MVIVDVQNTRHFYNIVYLASQFLSVCYLSFTCMHYIVTCQIATCNLAFTYDDTNKVHDLQEQYLHTKFTCHCQVKDVGLCGEYLIVNTPTSKKGQAYTTLQVHARTFIRADLRELSRSFYYSMVQSTLFDRCNQKCAESVASSPGHTQFFNDSRRKTGDY